MTTPAPLAPPTRPLPPKPLAPPARPLPPKPAPAAPAQAVPKKFGFSVLEQAKAQSVGIFGPGGIGKTSLACSAPGPVAVFDFDNSLPVLKKSLGTLDVRPVSGVTTWQDMRDALHDKSLWNGIGSIVIDSLTRAEQLCIAHTLETIKLERGATATSVEAYGYGKGYRHVFETMLQLLGDLDQHKRDGRNVVIIMHDCTANVPNPEGQDFIRWEPRLQAQNNGNIRMAVKEWLDHLLCVRYDIAVKDIKGKGKAEGSGTRTIYPVETPVHMAKSRSLREPFEYAEGSNELWTKLFS